MASTSLVYQVEDSVSQHRPMHRRPCYTLLQVLMGILVVLMLVLAGGVVWMKLSQNCGEKIWNVGITGKKEVNKTEFSSTNFTSPSEGKYLIVGRIFTKDANERCDYNNFKLLQGQNGNEIIRKDISEWFAIGDVSLAAGTELMIQLNCGHLEFDEEKSTLKVLRQE